MKEVDDALSRAYAQRTGPGRLRGFLPRPTGLAEIRNKRSPRLAPVTSRVLPEPS